MNHESNNQTEQIKRYLFKTKDACEMMKYMNRPDTYQSGRIYSHGIINLIKE